MGEINYAAITGDLVASRNVPDSHRAKVQREMLKTLKFLNDQFQADLARPAVLTAGDEIQALLRTPSQTVEFVQILKDHLFGSASPGQDIVFGVGWGPLSTGLLPEASSVEQLDGTCFHLARETLAQAKKRKSWVVFRGFGELEDKVLSSLFELMGAIRSGWSTTQSMHTVALRRLKTRVQLAKERGVSPSVVTESLQLARFDAIMEAEETARCVLEQYDQWAENEAAARR